MLEPTPTDAASLVRLATERDEECIVAMVREMHADPEWVHLDPINMPFSFSPEKTRATVQRATQRSRNAPDADSAWIGVVGEPGQLLGSVCVCVVPLDYSEGAHLEEAWNYVVPEHRNSVLGDALVEFSMRMADQLGLVLHLAAMTQARMAKSRFYQRRFGSPVACLYRYSPNGAV